MKQFIKQHLAACCLFLRKLFFAIEWLVRMPLSDDLKKRVRYEEQHKNLYILAGGPSLKDAIEHVNFAGTDVSVVNHFYKSPWFSKLRPRYYVLADPLFFSQEENIRSIISRVNWDMMLLVPIKAWRKLSILQSMPNKKVTVVPYNTLTYDGFECFRNGIYKRGLAMPPIRNVVVASIFLGVNMGYKNIRLYGVDHSWTKTLCVNNQNEVCVIDNHFYDTEKSVLLPYFKNRDTNEIYTMHELLRNFSIMFESHHVLRKYADEQGCRIFNCTKNSFIDAYERC